ncbi:MAG: hypothetical protein IRZ09_14140 [Variibacter sp.]|nr:hypothetical protein [Variibacter sp.]
MSWIFPPSSPLARKIYRYRPQSDAGRLTAAFATGVVCAFVVGKVFVGPATLEPAAAASATREAAVHAASQDGRVPPSSTKAARPQAGQARAGPGGKADKPSGRPARTVTAPNDGRTPRTTDDAGPPAAKAENAPASAAHAAAPPAASEGRAPVAIAAAPPGDLPPQERRQERPTVLDGADQPQAAGERAGGAPTAASAERQQTQHAADRAAPAARKAAAKASRKGRDGTQAQTRLAQHRPKVRWSDEVRRSRREEDGSIAWSAWSGRTRIEIFPSDRGRVLRRHEISPPYAEAGPVVRRYYDGTPLGRFD